MLYTSKLRKGCVVCHRFTWRRYRVVAAERSRVLVDPLERRESPICSKYHFWLDSRLLEVI